MAAGDYVGRDRAVADLRRRVDDTQGGRGGFCLVTGEAGIGKTALGMQTARYAEGAGCAVLWSTCWEGDGVPPYWPWVQILRQHAERLGPIPAGAAAILSTEIDAMDQSPVGGVSLGPSERFALFDAVGSVLVRSAGLRALLVVVDDLQWADVPSLSLLSFLVGQTVTIPLLLIGMCRDNEPDPEHPAWVVLSDLRRRAEVTSLAGLDEAEVGLLIDAESGLSASPALATQVFHRTGGNPFYVREVTRLLQSRGALNAANAGQGVPEGVRSLIGSRLARLSQPSFALLTVAAVTGREINPTVVQQLTEASMAQVTERLEEAVGAHVLDPPQHPDGPYRFAHDLFREALYEGLRVTARGELHLRVAAVLERWGSDVHPAELAHHFLRASVAQVGGADAVDKAVSFSLAAGVDARNRLAYEDAIGHLTRSLDALGLAGTLTNDARLELMLARAEVLRRSGETAAAHADYSAASQLSRRLQQPTALTRAALGIHALGLESGTSRAGCIDLLEEALDASIDDSPLSAQVLAALARELFLSDASDPAGRTRAATLSSAAVDIARRVGDDATVAECLLAAHDVIWVPGAAARRRAIATDMGRVARRAGDHAFEAEACLLRASAGLELADPQALLDLEEFYRLGTEVGQPHFDYQVITRRAAHAVMTGEFPTAERLLNDATAMAEATGEPDAWNVQTSLLWMMRTLQGRRAETEEVLRGCKNPQLMYWFDGLLGLAMLEGGNRTEAARRLTPGLQIPPEKLPFPYVIAMQWSEFGEAAVALGMSREAERYYNVLKPYAGTAVVIAAAVGFGGAVDHHLGFLACGLSRLDEAVRHFEAATTIHERMSAWPWLARSRAELAIVLSRRDRPADRVRVADLVGQVQQAAAEFGLEGLSRRIEQAATGPENVFCREGDIWRISYAGSEIRLRDAKGLADLGTMLRTPGQEIPATILTGSAAVSSGFGADPVLDRQAQLKYRQTIGVLSAELDTARQHGDMARAQTISDERDFLVRELTAAVGLRQQARGLGDDRERARKAVSARVKDAVDHIDAAHPVLGAHLRDSIRTGHLCCYQPSSAQRWRC